MIERTPLQIFEECGAIRAGHFLYTSGLHGERYVNKDEVYADPRNTRIFAELIGRLFESDLVEVVLAPAIGGAKLGDQVALWLSDNAGGREVLSVFSEKADGKMLIKRGYGPKLHERRVLVVEDVLTTEGSVRGTVEAARVFEPILVGVGAIFNRGQVTADQAGRVPRLESLINLKFQTWVPDGCPMCKQGIPLDGGLGHGTQKS